MKKETAPKKQGMIIIVGKYYNLFLISKFTQ